MVRNKTEKSNEKEPKKPRSRKQQTPQVVGPESHNRMEMSDPQAKMFDSMMPMIMMLLMLAILMPLLKRTSQNDGELKDQ